MDIDQHWLHSNRREVIKLLGHLLNARKSFSLLMQSAKLIANQSEACKAIEGNIDALALGVDETIKLCGQVADDLQSRMDDPHAKPAAMQGKLSWTKNITPFQRALIHEGTLELNDTPKFEMPKCQARAPAPLPFTLKRIQRKKRTKTRENIPI